MRFLTRLRFHQSSQAAPGPRFLAVLCLVLSALSQCVFADYYLASWNVKHLGWADEKRDWGRTAQVISPFDFVALQEVHTEESLARLEREVERLTGDNWDTLISGRALGSARYKEFYAFIWRSERFRYEGEATVFFDTDNWFFREPFSARFLSSDGKHDFIAANLHAIYGDSRSDREEEARQLDEYATWVIETFIEVSGGASGFLLMGDFNLPPQSPAFSGLRNILTPTVTEGATTLSKADFKYANLYDQIWTFKVNPEQAGIFDFPRRLKLSHEYARGRVSDHAPVFIRVSENGL